MCRESEIYEKWRGSAIAVLAESIEHWERLASGNRVDDEGIEGRDCACCAVFSETANSPTACIHCPVAIRTGAPHCDYTPWRRAYNEGSVYGCDTRAFRKAAADEVAFLRDTLRLVELGEVRLPSRWPTWPMEAAKP